VYEPILHVLLEHDPKSTSEALVRSWIVSRGLVILEVVGEDGHPLEIARPTADWLKGRALARPRAARGA
jgi:hypothetical protein